MKKKVLAALLCAAMTGTMLAGCGGGGSSDDSGSGSTEEAAEGEEGEAEPEDVTTVGPDSGTKMEMWSFVSQHNDFYAKMLEKWNEQNPDRQIQITFTTYPFADMHNKLMMSLQTGEGAPDLCDIERGQFPNFLQGEVQLYALNDALAPYTADLVQSRLDIYSKDGNYYGAPTHVGATVMYYNDELLSQYGIDYRNIKTWDDYTAAAEQLKEATNGEVKMSEIDTGGTDWMWLSMAEHGEDQVDEDGKAVVTDGMAEMLKLQKEWLDNDLAMICPAGQVDTEEGKQAIMDQQFASFPKALWYMSRFVSDMPDETGKWAIAPCPVFEEGQPRSVGIGGTGTVVTQQSEDPELAADFIAYAKCSYDGCLGIWQDLGFDVCNTSIWKDTAVTQDASNQYIAYFRTNPFDVLNEIEDEIGAITVNENTFILSDYLNVTTFNSIFEDGMDVDEALQECQDMVDIDQG